MDINDIRLIDAKKRILYAGSLNKEFAQALSEKLQKPVKNLTVHYQDKSKEVLKRVVMLSKNMYCCESGSWQINSFSIRNLNRKSEKQAVDMKLEDVEPDETLLLNKKKVAEIEESMEKSFIRQWEKSVKDKDGIEYSMVSWRNKDPSIALPLICDEIELFKGDEKVGYVKSKYTTDEYLEAYQKDIELSCGIFERFLNSATVDYIRVEEKFKGKGLGVLLYLNMGQTLSEQGIGFRSSSIISKDASAVWDKIDKLSCCHLRKEIMDDCEVNHLSVNKDTELNDYSIIKCFQNNSKDLKINNKKRNRP